jgi:hypothetical protein
MPDLHDPQTLYRGTSLFAAKELGVRTPKAAAPGC